MLYDISADGYHTALTREQIAELFYAGRLGRNDPCKCTTATKWRTIDELFPLLKCDNSTWTAPGRVVEETPIARILLAATAAILIVLGTIYAFEVSQNREDQIGTASSGATIGARRTSDVVQEVTPGVAYISFGDREGRTWSAARETERLDRERMVREQLQSERAAQADRMRADFARQERARQLAAGRDEIVALNQTVTIPNVGGSPVQVKIVDNDVTSFDVWINGSRPREVRKMKGIDGSRTNETLIYQNGNARLYYVWEISGRLNHCLLRVRED